MKNRNHSKKRKMRTIGLVLLALIIIIFFPFLVVPLGIVLVVFAIKKSKDKKTIKSNLEATHEKKRISEDELSIENITKLHIDDIFEAKVDDAEPTEVTEKVNIDEESNELAKCFGNIEIFLDYAVNMISSWSVKQGDFYSEKLRTKYYLDLIRYKDFYSQSSIQGKQFFQSVDNINKFIQNCISVLPDGIMQKRIDEYNDAVQKPLSEIQNITDSNKMVLGILLMDKITLCDGKGRVEIGEKKYTLSEFFQMNAVTALKQIKRIEEILNTEDSYPTTDISFDDQLVLIHSSYIIFLKLLYSAIEYFSSSSISDLDLLSRQYPITFDINKNCDLIKEVEEVEDPYISFEYSDIIGNHNDSNYTSFWIGSDRDNITIVVRFNNMEKLGDIHFSVLDNSAIDIDTLKLYKKFDVSWGDWTEYHACEIKFNGLTSRMGTIKLKVWSDCNPNCIGIIEGM